MKKDTVSLEPRGEALDPAYLEKEGPRIYGKTSGLSLENNHWTSRKILPSERVLGPGHIPLGREDNETIAVYLQIRCPHCGAEIQSSMSEQENPELLSWIFTCFNSHSLVMMLRQDPTRTELVFVAPRNPDMRDFARQAHIGRRRRLNAHLA